MEYYAVFLKEWELYQLSWSNPHKEWLNKKSKMQESVNNVNIYF